MYGVEGFRFLQAGNTFRGDFTNTMDVCGYIQFFRADWERNVGDIYYPVGGESKESHVHHQAAGYCCCGKFELGAVQNALLLVLLCCCCYRNCRLQVQL